MNRLFLTIIIFFIYLNTYATGVNGGYINYECIGNNKFIVTLIISEDCGSSYYSSPTSQIIKVTNTCGIPFNPSVSLSNISFQEEVSQICSRDFPLSSCNGGIFESFYIHKWSDTITLPDTCDNWIFSYDSWVRANSSNVAGTQMYHSETILNSTHYNCNSSSKIDLPRTPILCLNETLKYNLGFYDLDDDSLKFSLSPVKTLNFGSPLPALYNPGFSGEFPFPEVAIDSTTGELTITPTLEGDFVIGILVEEFDYNGVFKGDVLYEFFVKVEFCPYNFAPKLTNSGILNFSGNALQTGDNTIEACVGSNVCFDLLFTDSNSTDSIFINSNVTDIFPGASITQNSYFSPVIASICFTVNQIVSNTISPLGIYKNIIKVEATDDNCPISAMNSTVINVIKKNGTYLGQDFNICQGDSVQLIASGGTQFNWSIISGDPINIGLNFSCNNCPNPVAKPLTTTMYKVQSNLFTGCAFFDTVIVNVGPDFTFNLLQSDSILCMNSNIYLGLDSLIPYNYLFDWTPNNNLNSNHISNPIFNSSIPGIYNLNVSVDNQLGCSKKDSLSLLVLPVKNPNISISSNPALISIGDTAQLFVDQQSNPYCGTSFSNSCFSTIADTTIGVPNDTNSSFSYPAPFGHYYKGAKHQFLFLASELISSGLSAGKITELAWETVYQRNFATDTFYSFTINMGCTNLNSLSTWTENLVNVLIPQDIKVDLGWNNLILSKPYIWDGVSNLVIEICFNNINMGNYTRNWRTPRELTPFISSLYYRSDYVYACNSDIVQSQSQYRPITKFKVCQLSDPTQYSYQWFPNSNISSDSVYNPYVNPSFTTTYTAIASSGECRDTALYTLNVICDTCTLNITDTVCDSYTFNNKVYSQSGVYIDSVLSQNSFNPVNLDLTINPSYIVSIIDSSCSSFDYLGQTLNQSGLYSNSLSTINGCDSIVNLNLTIVIPSVQNIDSILCDGDSIEINNIYYSTPGLYYDSIPIADCYDLIIYDVFLDSLSASISLINGDLVAIVSGGIEPYNYIWNTGENTDFISPFVAGNYSLIVTDFNYCSAVVNFSLFLDIEKNTFKDFKIYPNPVNNILTIEFDEFPNDYSFKVLNNIGQIISKGSNTKINFSNYSRGFYFLEIKYHNNTEIIKLIKK